MKALYEKLCPKCRKVFLELARHPTLTEEAVKHAYGLDEIEESSQPGS